MNLKFLKFAIEKHPTTNITLEYLIKNNAIASLVIDASGKNTLLVNQYRPGVGENIYEIPAGIIEDGESAINTLYRELEEETGYTREDYKIIYSNDVPLCVSPGYTQERLYIYIVQLINDDIIPKQLKLDEGEDLIGKWFSLEEAEKLSIDMKTTLALNIYKTLK